MSLPTAGEIAQQVRAGVVHPSEVLETWLARAEAYDGLLGAFQLLRPDAARAEAAALAGRPDLAELPLAGVPVAIKDNVDVAGEPTRNGSAATSAAPAGSDHPVVQRLRAAGAVVVGKTRVPELCVWGVTTGVHGTAHNPWDATRTPGGSSGGTAAAVAAGLVPLGHGNDGMGSVRIPAACCGLVGIKPGTGVVPAHLGGNDWFGMAENGPLATTVADLALGLSVMAARPALADVTEPDRGLRVAVSLRAPLPGTAVDPEWSAAAQRAGDLLRRAGHDVRAHELDYPIRPLLGGIARWFAGTEADAAQVADRARLEPRTRRHAALGRAVTRLGLVRDADALAWRDAAERFFTAYDVLVTPMLARTPPPAIAWHRRGWLANMKANTDFAPFAAPWNLAGWPAMAVPAGRHSDGLPLSVQLVAPPGGEARLLAVAAQLEQLAPWPRTAPTIPT